MSQAQAERDVETLQRKGMACVCVDAMGGDEPPSVVLAGVELALDADPDLHVVIVGDEDVVVPFATAHQRCDSRVTTQSIGMDEHPVEAIRKKRDSSIVVGCGLVREGKAGGFFSAGSTGACMAAATLKIGRIAGIDRPALTTVLPGVKPTVLLDLGATPDCKPENIVQFAHMGCAYANVTLGCENPRVGLLNIGSEDAKGSLEAHGRFDALKESLPGFCGNAEGTDLFAGTFDVIVTDGFTGNIALKTVEATAKYLLAEVKAAAMSSLAGKVGGALLKPALRGVKAKLSGDEFGGAVLLGVSGVVVIGHGATSAEAVKNGTLVTADAIRRGLVEQIAQRCE